MRTALITAGLVGALALPAGALATTTPADKTNASKECKAERGSDAATQEAFRLKYGTNKNGKNAFGKCVSQRAKEEKAERKAARKKAKKACKAKASTPGYAKCVARRQDQVEQQQDAADMDEVTEAKNSAKECDAERTALGDEAFAAKYGTGKNGKNAFGKCVSSKSKANKA